MGYEVVYDIRAENHTGSSFVMAIVCLLAALVLFSVNQWRTAHGIPAISDRSGKPAPWLPLLPALISLFSFFIYVYKEYPAYKTSSKILIDAINQDRCRVSEGVIHNFHTEQQSSGRSRFEIDSFDIGDSHFSFSDEYFRAGYKKTAGNRGPLGDGINVRIYEYLGEIPRLEILKGSQAIPADNSPALLNALKGMKARQMDESPRSTGD